MSFLWTSNFKAYNLSLRAVQHHSFHDDTPAYCGSADMAQCAYMYVADVYTWPAVDGSSR